MARWWTRRSGPNEDTIAGEDIDRMLYKAFISYSHAADGRLSEALQRGLQQFARPWHKRRAMDVFRDRTDLSVRPRLWKNVQQGLDGSEYLILLASPAAAQSKWIKRELLHWWQTRKTLDNVLVVLTEGEILWQGDHFDWKATSALPQQLDWPGGPLGRSLDEGFDAEPHWFDLRWARTAEDTSLRNPKFLDAVATLAATLHGVPKRELVGEDVIQHRRFRRIRAAVVVALALLVVATSGAAAFAWRQRQIARDQRDRANIQRLVAESAVERGARPQRSTLLAMAALEQTPAAQRRLVTPAGQALLRSLSVLGGQPLEGSAEPVLGIIASAHGPWAFSWSETSAFLHGLSAEWPTSRALRSSGGVVAATFLDAGDRLLLLSRLAAADDTSARKDPGLQLGLWAIAEGSPQKVWQKRLDAGRSAAIASSPGGEWMVAGGRLWRTTNDGLSEEARLEDKHTGDIERAVFLSDHELATASGDRVLRWTFGKTREEMDGPLSLWALQNDENLVGSTAWDVDHLVAGRTGKWLAAVTTPDSAVHLWHLESGQARAWTMSIIEGEGDTPSIERVGFSSNDRWLVVVSDFGAVRALNLRALAEAPAANAADLPLVVLHSALPDQSNGAAPSAPRDVHASLQAQISAADLDPAGRWLAAANASHVLLWSLDADVLTTSPQAVLATNGAHVRAFAFMKDRLLAGTQEGVVLEWDMTARFKLRQRRGHELYVNLLLPAMGGRRVISGAIRTAGKYVGYEVERRDVRAWWLEDASAGALPQTVSGLDGQVTVAAMDRSQRWLVAGAGSGFLTFGRTLGLFDLRAADRSRPVVELDAGAEGPQALAMGTRWFATAGGREEASDDPDVRLWSLEHPTAPAVVLHHPESIYDVSMDAADRWLVAHGEHAWLWDLRPLQSGRPAARVEALAGVSMISLSPDGGVACAVDERGQLKAFTLGDADPTISGSAGPGASPAVRVSALPRGLGCIAQRNDGHGWLLSREKQPAYLANLARFAGSQVAVGSAEVPLGAPEAQWFFSSSLSARIADGAGAGSIGWTEGAASADGLRWAALSGASVRWLDPMRTDSHRVGELTEDGFVDTAHRVLLAGPKGRHLVTSDLEHVRLRDLELDDPAAHFVELPGSSVPIAASADGSWLVCAGDALGAAALFPLDVEQALHIARKAVGRDLTADERRRYTPPSVQ
jgi:hypothetical protein